MLVTRRGVVLAVSLVVGAANSLNAQSLVGVIRGRVFAMDSTVIPDAVVSWSVAGETRTARSDRNGLFSVGSLLVRRRVG
jgi:hypothetical protein